MSQIYRVYSNYITNDRERFAVSTWDREGIINIPVNDSDLKRSVDNLPFLKDLLDIAAEHCTNDNDVILYTNTDICLAYDGLEIPMYQNFFSVRKEVTEIKYYSSKDLENILYENSVNCDTFGLTKKWYIEHRDKIPDFIIGSPKWDLVLLMLLTDALRINNITYHIKHDSVWKTTPFRESNIHNNFLYNKFVSKYMPELIGEDFAFNRVSFFKYMSMNKGFDYLLKPVFIAFYTPSHKQMFDEIFLPSFKDVYNLSLIHI